HRSRRALLRDRREPEPRHQLGRRPGDRGVFDRRDARSVDRRLCGGGMQVKLRAIEARDREKLAALLRGVENFNENEVGVALELIDGAIKGPESEYFALVAEDESGALGG